MYTVLIATFQLLSTVGCHTLGYSPSIYRTLH